MAGGKSPKEGFLLFLISALSSCVRKIALVPLQADVLFSLFIAT